MRIYKYRIYPTKEQEEILNNSLKVCSELWNTALAYNERLYKDSKILIPAKVGYTAFFEKLRPAYHYKLQNIQEILPMMKEYEKLTKLNRLDIIHSQPYQEVLQRLDKSFKEFFAKTRKKPRYKKTHNYRSMTFTQYGPACHIPQIENQEPYNKTASVKLSKIGEIKMIYHREIPSEVRIKQAIVKKMPSGRWFISFITNYNGNNFDIPETDNIVAYDRGLKYLLAGSDGTTIDAPKTLNKYIDKIKKLSKKLSRKYESAMIKAGLKNKSRKKINMLIL